MTIMIYTLLLLITNHLLFVVDGLKIVEVEKCKRDLSVIKEQVYNAQKKMIDYNRLRWASTLFNPFLSILN